MRQTEPDVHHCHRYYGIVVGILRILSFLNLVQTLVQTYLVVETHYFPMHTLRSS